MAKKETAVPANSFSDLDEIINKEFEGLTDLSKVDTTVNTWYDFGVYALNYISSKNLFHGVPAGRITSIKGRSGCLSADTLIPINRGNRTGTRYYRIEDLYKKLKGERVNNPHLWNKNIPTNTFSMYEDGYIKYNEILQVIDSGIKNTFTLKTLKGREIRCTDEHYFKVLDHMLEGRGNPEKDNFVSLKKLKIGDVIYCKSEAKSFLLNINNGRKTGRREINGVQFHPFARSKKIGKYKYKRIHFSRLVFEAFINKLNIEDYINIIKYNQEKASKLIYLPMDKVIHHINFDPTDDRLENLKVLNKKEHDFLHSVSNYCKLGNNYSELDTVVSIESFGEEHTYDIEMKKGPKNFIANGFVTHNTGKSLLLAQIVKDPKVEKVIAIGSEGGGLSVELFNFVGASLEKIRLQSFNTFSNYRVNKKNGDIEEVTDAKFPVKKDTEEYIYVEGATRFLKRFINAIEFKGIKSNIVILMDSLANFKSIRELSGGQDMGSRAKDVNMFFGIFDNAFERTNIAFVFTNKVYTNLGNIYDPWKEAGGEGAIYNPSLSLFLSDTSSTEDKTDAEIKTEKDRRKTALGSSLKSIKASVDKSRFGTEYRNITFLIDFAYGPVKLSGMFELCRDFGILEKLGKMYSMPGIIDKPFYKKNFIDVLSENEQELLQKIQIRLEQAESDIKNKKSSIKASDMEDISEETEYEVSDMVKQMEKDM